LCCPALLAACGNHFGEAEDHSGIGLKLFGFIPEAVFTFTPESCSRSSRNTVREGRRQDAQEKHDTRAKAAGMETFQAFCKAATIDEIKRRGYVLTPGIYVGAAEVEGDVEPFDQKMRRLTAELQGRFVESDQIEPRT
jgi:hypothetical protein